MSFWLQAALPVLAGLLTASGALLGVRLSIRGNDRATEQRELAASREEWWRRTAWAAELAMSESPAKREIGLMALTALARSDLAQRDDHLLLDVFWPRVLNADRFVKGLVDGLEESPPDAGEERSEP